MYAEGIELDEGIRIEIAEHSQRAVLAMDAIAKNAGAGCGRHGNDLCPLILWGTQPIYIPGKSFGGSPGVGGGRAQLC